MDNLGLARSDGDSISIQTFLSGLALKRTIFSVVNGCEIFATMHFQVLCTTRLLSFSEMCFWLVFHLHKFMFGIKIFSFSWIQSLFLDKIIISKRQDIFSVISDPLGLLYLSNQNIKFLGINFESRLWQVCIELFRHPSRPVAHHFESFSFSLPCCYIYPTFSRNT